MFLNNKYIPSTTKQTPPNSIFWHLLVRPMWLLRASTWHRPHPTIRYIKALRLTQRGIQLLLLLTFFMKDINSFVSARTGGFLRDVIGWSLNGGGRLGWWEVVQVEREGSGFELETGSGGGGGGRIRRAGNIFPINYIQQSHNTRRPSSVRRLRGCT